MSFQSETIREVSDQLDLGGQYKDIVPVRESARGRLFAASRAGKRLILKAAASDSAKDIEALKREYEISLLLSHPSIATVFTYESESPVGPCIVMEYVDGETLREWLAARPSRTARRKVYAQLLDAVEYLHRKSILHNDLSPENILISRTDNCVKLIDFGFSDDDIHFLGKGRGCTRAYASPELLSGGRLDSRSDIYSLGALMRDIFGGRFRRIASRACRTAPEGRFASVAALRRAWTRARALPAALAAVAGLAAVAAVAAALAAAPAASASSDAVDIASDASVVASEAATTASDAAAAVETIRTEQSSRIDTLAAYKAKIDAWYASEAPVAQQQISAAASWDEAFQIWSDLTDRYCAFWQPLFKDCPESVSPELAKYLADKYNSSFPLLPPRK